MSELKAKISVETIYYFNLLNEIYRNNQNDLRRDQIIERAYKEAGNIKNWDLARDRETISMKDLRYVKPEKNHLKVDIDDQVKEGIEKLRHEIPNSFRSSKSISIGKTLKYLLKVALILNLTNRLYLNEKNNEINIQIKKLEEDIKPLVSNNNIDLLHNIIGDFKENLILE